jgi:hypothetical protein
MKFLIYGFFYALGKKMMLASLCMSSLKGWGQFKAPNALKHLDPYVINCNGGSTLVNQIIIDWTVGNMGNTFSAISRPALILSTGYLQNSYNVTALFKQIDSFGLQIKVGPNPFRNTLHIYCAQDGLDIITIKLFDSQGIMIKNILGPFSGIGFDQILQIQKLSNPICYVQIQYKVANEFILQRTYKLLQYL